MPLTRTAAGHPAGRQFGLLTALVLAILGYQINATMISPTLPHVITELHTTPGVIGLSQTLFFLVGSLSQVTLARLSDYRGCKQMMLIACAVLIAGNLACMLAPNVEVFIAGRILQGISAAIFPLAFLALHRVMTPERFGWAAGVITAVNGGFAGVDAVAGGKVADTIGFRGVFVAGLVISIIGTLAVVFVVPKLPASSVGRMDWGGVVLLWVGLSGVLIGLAQGQSWGWISVPTAVCLLGGLTTLVLFGFTQRGERRSGTTRPIIDTALLRSRRAWPLLLTSALTLGGAFGALALTFPLFTQDKHAGFGMSSFTSALLFSTPAQAIGVIGAPIAGWIGPRLGWNRTLRIGATGTLIAFAVIGVCLDSHWALFAMLALLGITYSGLTMTSLNGYSVVAAPEAKGALPGLNGACIGGGASFGIAVASAVINAGTHNGQTAHAAYAGAVWAAFAMLALALITALTMAKPPTSEETEQRQGEAVQPTTVAMHAAGH
ncbi:MFS transporter [Streptomyces antimycoticus]|uniref:MFS transporter n=1 Tax=Streptomyces antimycoticus TaxID=68175 RepID=UPI000A378FFE|nr:MFS transporter [Streptomyces antimycoticus]